MNRLTRLLQLVKSDHISSTATLLGRTKAFAGLNRSELREVERIVHTRHYEPDEVVFHQDDPGLGLYVVAAGSVDIQLSNTGSSVRLVTLEEGDFFGELALLDEQSRSATAISRQHSTLLGFFRPDLLRLMDYRPRLSAKILLNLGRIVAARLRQADAVIAQQGLQRPATVHKPHFE